MKKVRVLVVLVVVASLLGLRTAYACAHMGGAAVADCCCKDSAARCPMRHKCTDDAMAQGSACCVPVTTVGAGDQDAVVADQSHLLDLPAPPAATHVAERASAASFATAFAVVLSPASNGTLTWLRTGRLRI